MIRPATFTEANAWVHLSPESFTRHFPCIRSVWQAEGGQLWVEADGPPSLDQPAFALWQMAEQRTGEPLLPCGCWVRVRYRYHARETVCAFSNLATAFRTTLRIAGLLMLIASAPSHIHEALCVHPHDEGTVQAQLEQALLKRPGPKPKQVHRLLAHTRGLAAHAQELKRMMHGLLRRPL